MRRRWLQALAAVAALLPAACRVGPDYRPPQSAAGAEAALVSLDASAETAQSPRDDWWQLYNDERLDGLLQEAFRANADVAAAEANLSAARALLQGAHAPRYPQSTLAAAGIYGRDPTTDEILELNGQAPATVWTLDDVFQVSYEVDFYGRVRRNIEASRADAQALIAARDGVRVLVAAETTRAYVRICALGEQIEVARHSLEVVSREAEITVNRNEAGANSNFDVARAQALVAQVRSAIPPLEGQRRAELFQLAALLGRTPARAPTEIQACLRPPQLTALLPVGDGAALLKRRPDVRRAERALAAATARIGVVTADLYPRVSLGGFYGGAGLHLPDLAREGGLVWGLGPSVSWSFPNQTSVRARIRQAQANAAAALAVFDAAVLGALKETEQSLAAYSAELERRKALGEAQDRAHEAFGQAQAAFLAGALSNLELLTTEQSLIATDAAVAACDAALVEDQIAVFKALGGGWRSATGAH